MESIRTLVVWLAIIEGVSFLSGCLGLELGEGLTILIGAAMIGITIALVVKTNK